jgi:prepilin-type processing-associated H-X9-DG protein
MTDYNAAWGTYGSNTTRGPFGNDGAANIGRIPDGTSNTIGIGESATQRRKTYVGFGPFWGAGTHTAVHGYTPSGDARFNVNALWSPPANQVYAWVFSSNHTAGANFLLLDGSVKFIRNDIDYAVFSSLNWMQDGATVSAP